MSLSSNLMALTCTCEHLKASVRHSIRSTTNVTLKSSISDHMEFLQLWAIDLARLVVKLGRNLVQRPSSIYRLMPPFCPWGSMIQKSYCTSSSTGLSVVGVRPPVSRNRVIGVRSPVWNDCLAKMSVGQYKVPSKVLCTEVYLTVLVEKSGTVERWAC